MPPLVWCDGFRMFVVFGLAHFFACTISRTALSQIGSIRETFFYPKKALLLIHRLLLFSLFTNARIQSLADRILTCNADVPFALPLGLDHPLSA